MSSARPCSPVRARRRVVVAGDRLSLSCAPVSPSAESDLPQTVEATAGIEPALRDEIHRRLGRNLLALQKVERAWKHLLVTCVAEGAVAEGIAGAQRWIGRVQKMNMGDALAALFDEVLTAEPKERPFKGDRSKGAIRIRLTFEVPPDQAESADAQRERWKQLVDGRNHLVHHFIERWGHASPGELESALVELDAQFELARTVLDETMPLVECAAATRDEQARHAQSEAGQRETMIALTVGSMLNRLCRIASEKPRKDGWTYETTAGADLRQDAEGVRLMAETFGADWLPRLLRESPEIFEVMEEPIPNGPSKAHRRLYRLRSS